MFRWVELNSVIKLASAHHIFICTELYLLETAHSSYRLVITYAYLLLFH